MNKFRRVVTMGSLILAGESIYLLPYALRREYENTLLETTGLTNTELGFVKLAFGVLAVLCYFPGGWLADRISARKLLTISLVSTASGGLYMMTLPGFTGLLAVHAFWGVSSILTFWAALIKATRAWGGRLEQGRAFGILEGGRGLVGAVLPSIGLAGFALFASPGSGLRAVILLYCATALGVAVLTWVFVPENEHLAAPDGPAEHTPPRKAKGEKQLTVVVRMPVVWLLALVIFCAYLGYLGTFNLAKFAQDAYGMGEVMGAGVSLFALWVRALAAFGAGFIADRVGASRAVICAFAIMALFYTSFALVPAGDSTVWVLWTNTAAIATASYALRGIFYALMQEGRIPTALTGTAVGVVSFIGYTPDAFTGLMKGSLLDAFPGTAGHQLFFAILATAAVIGCGAAVGIRWIAARAEVDVTEREHRPATASQ